MCPERSSPRIPTGRLAPSPTGLLHVGHARTFLLAWWLARSEGGRIVLRIDDLDADRASPNFAEAAIRDLQWLGLDWDGPAYLQSSGLERMTAAIQVLLDAGLAYACVCSRAEILNAQSAPHQGAAESRYPGTCRGRYPSLAAAEQASGRKPSVRLLVAEGVTEFTDELYGRQRFDVQAEAGDFVIARRDGAPAYQLAVVLDDSTQGVTQVVRGADLLPSTARQLLIHRLLRLPEPRWHHVPLVTDTTGRRLAKRARDLSLAELRARGVDPHNLVGWAARSVGLPLNGRVSAAEVLPGFDPASITREPTPLSMTQIDFWSK